MSFGNSAFGFSGSGGGGGGGTIGGGGTLNYIAKFTPNGLTIGNSLLFDNGVSVGLGTITPDSSAILDLNSTTQGFLTPRMTQTQRNAIASPVLGLFIFNTTSAHFNFWDGSTWQVIQSSTITSDTLSQVLAAGNTTGGLPIIMTSGDTLNFSVGSGGTLNSTSTTALRSWLLPDSSGTIALTSDIPSFSGLTNGYIPYWNGTTLADSWISEDINGIILDVGKKVTLTNDADVYIDFINDNTSLSNGNIVSGGADVIFKSGGISNYTTFRHAEISSTDSISLIGSNSLIFDSPIYNFVQLSANTIGYIDSSSNLVNGTWTFSGNNILPITTGSNIGDATHRIGTIFMASVFDYANNLTFYNGTTNTMTVKTNGYVNVELGNITLGSYTGSPTVSAIYMNVSPSGNNYTIARTATNISYFNGDSLAFAIGGSVKAETFSTYTQYYQNLAVGSLAPSGTNNFVVSGESYLKGISSTSSDYTLKVDNSASSPLLYVRNDGLVWLNNNNSGDKLLLTSGGDGFGIQSSLLQYFVNNSSSSHVFGQGSSTSFSEFMRITGVGRVGIGTNNPQSIFQVKAASNANFYIGQIGGVLNIQAVNDAASANVPLELYASQYAIQGGNVGIGISSPASKLHIKGIDSTSSNYSLKVDNSASSAILYARNDGNVAIGTSTPTNGTRLHVYRSVNDFLYEVKVENPNAGVSSAASILIQSDVGKMEFGQLSNAFTTYTGYGQTGDTFIRSGLGSRNMNFLTDPSNTGKFLFFSRLNPTTDAATPSLAIDGLKVGIGKLPSVATGLDIEGVIKTTQPSVNGAGEWKLGKVISGASVLDGSNYVEVEIDGNIYKLALIL